MKQLSVSKPTLGRLPMYLQYLKLLPESCGNISATMIAKALDLGEAQVRKDLGFVIGTGRPKTGHVTSELIAQLEKYLGCRDQCPAVLVGAGKLGKALLEYDGFSEYGMEISAAFDVDEHVIGTCANGKDIFHLDEMRNYCKQHRVKIGIITAPKTVAQEVCDYMVSCGIEAIWSFAPCLLKVPENVLVQQENLALSLAYLKQQIPKCCAPETENQE